MKNFSQVQLGESDNIKQAYETEGRKQLFSPKPSVIYNLTAVSTRQPFTLSILNNGPVSESFDYRVNHEYNKKTDF